MHRHYWRYCWPSLHKAEQLFRIVIMHTLEENPLGHFFMFSGNPRYLTNLILAQHLGISVCYVTACLIYEEALGFNE